MIVHLFAKVPSSENEIKLEVSAFGKEDEANEPHRVEVPMVATDDGQQYTVILLDAEDSFDVVVHYPDGDREIVWNLLK
jgi:hypothetical protein